MVNVDINKKADDLVKESQEISSESYPCRECGKSFTLESSLQMHLIKHGQKLKCDVCSVEFNSTL